MWFKNLKLYRLAKNGIVSPAQLQRQLASQAFVSQGGSKEPSVGWIPPRADSEQLFMEVGGQIQLALRIEKKLLPSSVIQTVVKERAIELEGQQGFKPGRKQIKDLKEQVTDELTPRAFSIARDTKIWMDPVNHWFVVDAASVGLAEQALSLVGKSLHPYPVEPLVYHHSPSALMTRWMAHQTPAAGFSIELDCQWQSSGQQAGLVRYLRHDMTPTEIERHIQAGHQCSRLGLTWQDRISFVLTEQGDIKRLTALDILDQSDEQAHLDAHEKQDADFMLMTAELAPMLDALVQAFSETDS